MQRLPSLIYSNLLVVCDVQSEIIVNDQNPHLVGPIRKCAGDCIYKLVGSSSMKVNGRKLLQYQSKLFTICYNLHGILSMFSQKPLHKLFSPMKRHSIHYFL